MKLVSRFAPSPTGYLHIGNLRTAILNYLISKKSGGKFILRIDDTDMERSDIRFIDQIKNDLDWLGLEWDQLEMQSDRIDLYQGVANKLRDDGLLYECFETPAELELKRKKLLNMGKPPVYDRSALALSNVEIKKLRNERASHWRFKLSHKRVAWIDNILGSISIDCSSVSDPVLIRADGQFLYTLASVFDDIDLEVNYVVRGSDHVTNTGTQIQIISSLKGSVPSYAHHSLLTGSKGEPLSKRLGNLSLKDMRINGVEPKALFLFMASLGSSKSIDLSLTANDVIQDFEISNFGSSSTKFDHDILKNFSTKYLAKLHYTEVYQDLISIGIPKDLVVSFWEMASENIETRLELKDLWKLCTNGVEPVVDSEDLEFVKESVKILPDTPWDKNTWKNWIDKIKMSTERRGKNLFLPLRKALTGKTTGPDMNKLLPLLKRLRVLE
jgi:glutamyl-tRNA synthetase